MREFSWRDLKLNNKKISSILLQLKSELITKNSRRKVTLISIGIRVKKTLKTTKLLNKLENCRLLIYPSESPLILQLSGLYFAQLKSVILLNLIKSHDLLSNWTRDLAV